MLAEAAVQAVRRWRYRPYSVDGRSRSKCDANYDPVHIATGLRALQDCEIQVENLAGQGIWRAAPH